MKIHRKKETQFAICVLLFFIGLATQNIAGVYMPLGNPIIYLLWFWIGENIEISSDIVLKKIKL